MKNIMLLFLLMAFQSFTPNNISINKADDLTGAWVLSNANEEQALIFMDGYFTHTTYNKQTKSFVQTRGGNYEFKNNTLQVLYEFDTKNTDAIGNAVAYKVNVTGNDVALNLNKKIEKWKRIDDGTENLAGTWKITARKQNGQLTQIHQQGTRKTVKILSSTRFQWAAIDPGTKQFMGTGGGTYSFVDGKYTENIEFFSRDSTRVGSSLTFDGKIVDGNWHHSGLSSKGDAIYEVWSRDNK